LPSTVRPIDCSVFSSGVTMPLGDAGWCGGQRKAGGRGRPNRQLGFT